MAILSSAYNVESNIQTTPYTSVPPTVTVGIIINTALTVTKGVLSFETNGSLEYISFGSTSVASGRTTLIDVVRNLTTTLNDFSQISATGLQHTPGVTIVRLVNYHALYNLKAGTTISNTFTANQQISGTNKWYFNDTDTYIYDDGTDLKFKSSAQAEVSLATLANLAGVNDKTKVSATDTTSGYLATKQAVPSGSGLVQTIGSPAGDERLNLAINLEASSPSLQIASNELGVKIKSGGGLAKDSNGLYATPAVQSGVANGSITDKDALAYNGDTQVNKADGDALNKAFLFAGIATESKSSGLALNYSTPGPFVTVTAFTMAQRQNARLWTGQSQATSNTTTDTISATTNWRFQTFTPAVGQDNVSQIILNFTKTSSPNGSSTVMIYATTAGLPSGAALATATTILNSAISSGDTTFVLTTPLAVTPGTVYAIVWSSGISSGGSLAWNYQNTNVYAAGNRGTSSDSGSTWSADATADFRFSISYRGIAGEPVFLSNTAGSLDLTPGQYAVKVGYAVSATQIVLEAGTKWIYGTFSGSMPIATGAGEGVTVNASVLSEITIGGRAQLVLYAADFNITTTTGATLSVVSKNYNVELITSAGGKLGFSSGSDGVVNLTSANLTTLGITNWSDSDSFTDSVAGDIQLTSAGADSLSFTRTTTVEDTTSNGGTFTVKFIALIY